MLSEYEIRFSKQDEHIKELRKEVEESYKDRKLLHKQLEDLTKTNSIHAEKTEQKRG